MNCNREKKVILLDWFYFPVTFLFFVIVLLVSFSFVIIGSFGPDTYTSHNVTTSFTSPTKANQTIRATVGPLAMLNQELYFFLAFTPKKKLIEETGFSKQVSFNSVRLRCMDTKGEGWWNRNKGGVVSEKTIQCEQGSGLCDKVIVFHEMFLVAKYYQVEIELRGELPDFFENEFEVMFQYVDDSFTYFELIYRYAFLALNLFCLVVYVMVLIIRQKISFWTADQWWMLALLIFLVFFNNPLFVLHFVTAYPIFPTLNNIFKSVFYAALMLYILIFPHATYRKNSPVIAEGNIQNSANPKKKSWFKGFMEFYVPKILLVFSLTLSYLVYNIYMSFMQNDDPAFRLSENEDLRTTFIILPLCLIVVYALSLFYFAFRLILEITRCSNKKIKMEMIKRLIFFIFSGVMIMGDLIFFIIMTQYGGARRSSVIVPVHMTFNTLIFLYSFLHLPTAKVEQTQFEHAFSRLENDEVDIIETQKKK